MKFTTLEMIIVLIIFFALLITVVRIASWLAWPIVIAVAAYYAYGYWKKQQSKE